MNALQGHAKLSFQHRKRYFNKRHRLIRDTHFSIRFIRSSTGIVLGPCLWNIFYGFGTEVPKCGLYMLYLWAFIRYERWNRTGSSSINGMGYTVRDINRLEQMTLETAWYEIRLKQYCLYNGKRSPRHYLPSTQARKWNILEWRIKCVEICAS